MEVHGVPANLVLAGSWDCLAVGIAFHVQFMWRLRRERREMRAAGLLHDENGFPISFTLVVAFLLLLLGIGAIVGVSFGLGPFQ